MIRGASLNFLGKRRTGVQEPADNDILVPFEIQNVPLPYRAYYVTKRHNLLSTIQQFPYIWNGFMRLDAILQREFDDLQRVREPGVMFPTILFMNAHQKLRVAFELGCETCLPEAHSILRDAIESAAHANRLASNPHLLKQWIEKNDNEAAKKVFQQEFEHYKATQLFDGSPELHALWKQFSELGSHTNLNSVVTRFETAETKTDLEFRYNYLGGQPKVFVPALFEMLLACDLVENLVFKLAPGRLQLDPQLVDMRKKFDAEKEATRQIVINTFNLTRPFAPPREDKN